MKTVQILPHWALVGVLILFGFPAQLYAVPEISLARAFTKNGQRLSLTIAVASSAPACFIALYASPSKSELNGTEIGGTPLTSVGAASLEVELVVPKLKRIAGASSKKVHLISEISCVGDSARSRSNIVTLILKPKFSSSVNSVKQWISQLKSKLLKPKLKLEDRFPALSFSAPVDLQTPPDGSGRLFVVEQAGLIKVFGNDPAVSASGTFIDLSSRIETGGERGLLGLSFHPDFTTNGFFFVHYTKKSTGAIVIARYHVDNATPNQADAASELVILEVAHPVSNHNAGQLAFGGDGFLYLGMGDGGGGGDPSENGQNRSVLLGKLLRIDVNSTSGALNYAIPSSNPFVGNIIGAREEIFALGLRNPWRFSFDPPTGRLWLADVGQNAFEEVNLIVSGGNYGWNTMEGKHCFDPASACDQIGLILPLAEYSHAIGESVSGGHVYRGSNIGSLSGAYLFADFVSGRIFALRHDGLPTAELTTLLDTELNISSFGMDGAGEQYVVSYGDGKIYRINKS